MYMYLLQAPPISGKTKPERVMFVDTNLCLFCRSGITDVSDLTLIRLFFAKPETWLYKQFVATEWYAMLCEY